MVGDSENKVKVLAQNDPFSAQHPHFDFQELRREGLKHIGKLSGKIWTDHNTHDPGITILEELCYALIDLGYRTTLPMEDLLAEPRGNSTTGADTGSPHHENFFTPYEILSCNPTTVLDFRKLLLEVEGVRNAWLKPVEADAYPDFTVPNGLYSIRIQKEIGADEAKVKKSVREILSAHRNLCEDFLSEITVLCPLEVGVCADVEISKTVDASVVYEAIIKAVEAYIAPDVQYYTLKELLDKGRAIEEIFAGRPMWRADKPLRNAGFVDSEELEALPFRDELHGSDLYAAILAVDGVVAVRNLAFQPRGEEKENGKTIPCVTVASGFVAEFSLDCTCINLQTAQGRVFLDKDRITARLEGGGKPRRGYEYLDLPVPEGRYRPQLADYYSIQHDFPLVYGIGKGGLPAEAPLLRKVQARQLKGYLLFYDQLLANYLAQVANLRHLFSLRQESKRPDIAKHTYFSQGVESVPDWQRLLPAYSARALTDGSILAIPVANDAQLAKKLEDLKAFPLQELRITASCKPVQDEMPHFAVSSQSLLEIHIRQSIRDFRQNAYSLELRRDGNGYLFILRFRQVCEWLLISFHRYQSLDEAREAAHFTVFLASQPEYYSRKLQQVGADSPYIDIGHQFDLVYDPVAYAAYLQFLVENEDLYLQRREAFLDHLLARFAHQFTDYALLRFGAEANEKPERRQTVEDKSRFLSQLDNLSRDRGRAFDYLQPSWGTENVSGFEKRVSLLAGMPEFKRRHLSKFEVVERFRIEMEDLAGEPWFAGIETYRSRDELGTARKDLVGQLGDTDTYDRLRFRFRGFDPAPIRRIFSRAATAENIEPSRYVYALVLKDSNGHALTESRTQNYAAEVLAWQELSRFIEEIKEGEGKELVATGAESRLYIDNRQLQCCIDTIITYKWRRYDSQGGHSASASAAHPSFASAIDDFAENGEYGDLIVAKADVALWSLCPGKGHPPLVSIHAFNNEVEAQHAWRRCKHDGQLRERYQHAPEPGGAGIRVTLATASGFELASATIADEQALSPDQYIGLCMAAFGRDAGKLAFPALPTAFGWRLAQPTDTPDRDVERIESVLLFRDIPGALFGLIYALEAAKQANNYYEAGTEDNPDYRILLRSSCGLFIATTQSYTDATERNQNLEIVKGQMKALCPPLEVKEEPRRYRWELYRTTDGQVVFECGQGRDFDSAEVAGKDFEQAIRRVFEEQPKSPLGRQVYSFGLKSIEDKYRFIYCLNDSVAEALPLLRSKDEFNAGEVREKYTRFVAALPQMVMEIQNDAALVSSNDAPAAVLVDDTDANRKSVDSILRYMRVQYGDDKEASANSKWIYRLLDRDNPLAKSQKSYQTMDEIEKAKQALCRFEPCPLIPQKDVIRVICSEGKPNKYHYALFLGRTDGSGDECATLISYMGYTNEDMARTAGEENWLKLIELAADERNYGDGKRIADKEIYAQSTGSECDRASVHLAVKPEAVCTEDAVARAKCYPIRITYKKDDKGNLPPQAVGFHFQGYDEKTKINLWRSTVDYRDVRQALEAYQIFLTLLKNSDSCRIECDDGCYRIHLVEILAESGEFDTEAEAWGDMPESAEDKCGRPVCPAQGVRLFAQTAIAEAAFMPVRDGDCYRFDVVGNGCVLASHPHSHPDRTSAMRAEERARACVRDEGMHLVEHILLRPRNGEGNECLLPVCADLDCTLEWQAAAYPDPDDPRAEENNKAFSYAPGTDPYSFWATVVLPSWTERFRNSERRHFFRQMLYREVPAMVGLNIVWLGPRQMHDFEKVLKSWLSSMRCPPAICESMDAPFCDMVEAIEDLCNESPCPDPDADATECDCFSFGNQRKSDNCIEAAESLFWLACRQGREPEAPLHEIATSTLALDASAIRKVLNDRAERYKKHVNDIDYALAKETESYRRASHFLSNPPTLDAFKLLTGQMLDDIKRKDTKKGSVLLTVFCNAFWYLLDHLLSEHPTEVVPDADKMLPSLLQEMENKGAVLKDLARGWNGEVFGELFGTTAAKAVNGYLTLVSRD